VAVAPALGFYVARLVDEALDEVLVQVPALQRVMAHIEAAQLVVVMHQHDAAPAAAVRALHHQRVAVRVREFEQRSDVAHRVGDAWDWRHLGALGDAPGGDLVAQIGQRLRRRPDPDGTGVNHFLGEGSHFGEEAVARVDGIRAAATQYVNHQLFVEIGVAIRVAGKQIRLVGHLDVLRVAVLLGIDGHGGNAHFARGAHDSQSDFTTIGHQYCVDVFDHIF
jgi:hypothetical protein